MRGLRTRWRRGSRSRTLPALDKVELALIPAAAESALPAGLVGRLPASAPPAPWRLTLDCVAWLQHAGPGAGAALPHPLRRRRAPRWVAGAFVGYSASPVGPYSEVFAALVQRRTVGPVVHVPFMAVDSLESLRGGRANWALPKTPAEFHGRPSSGEHLRAEGMGWWMTANVQPFGPRLPLPLRLAFAQVRPDGTIGSFSVGIRGRARLARVDVAVSPDASLATWMPPGRHLAVQWLGAAMHVGHPVTEEAARSGWPAGSPDDS